MSTSKKCGHHPDLICGCGVMPEPTPNPQHVAEFERLFGESQGKRRSMSENTNERRPADEGTDGNRRGPAGYLCCKHCKEDSIHDVPTDGHDGPCSTCDDPGAMLRDRAEAAEAERDRARSLAATLEARLAQVEAQGGGLIKDRTEWGIQRPAPYEGVIHDELFTEGSAKRMRDNIAASHEGEWHVVKRSRYVTEWESA